MSRTTPLRGVPQHHQRAPPRRKRSVSESLSETPLPETHAVDKAEELVRDRIAQLESENKRLTTELNRVEAKLLLSTRTSELTGETIDVAIDTLKNLKTAHVVMRERIHHAT